MTLKKGAPAPKARRPREAGERAPMQRKKFFLPDHHAAMIDDYATAHGVSASEALRRILDAYNALAHPNRGNAPQRQEAMS